MSGKKVVKAPKKKTDDDKAPCHFCKAPTLVREGFCYGCKHVTCEKCSKNYSLMGAHDVDEHLIDPEEERCEADDDDD